MRWQEKTILFDLDGTLIDTAPDLHAAMAYAFALEDLEAVDLPTVRSAIGHGARAMILRSAEETGIRLSDPQTDRIHKNFLDYYIAHIADHSRPFHGITETLDVCLDQGAALAVCTNKTQDLAERLLTEIGLIDKFSAVLGADKTSEKKPSATHLLETISLVPQKTSSSIMIGDSSTDANAAKAARIPFIFMTYGYPDRPLTEIEAKLYLDTAMKLPEAIEQCFS